jgi:hypothetical protein
MLDTPKTSPDNPGRDARPNVPEPALLPNPVTRALPRTLGVAGGLAMAMAWDTGVLSYLGFGLLLLSVPHHPVAWWRYVRTGLVPQPPTDAKYLQRGTWRVDVVTRQEATLETVKAIREVTGLGVDAARALIEQAGPVADGLSADSAAWVRAQLEQSGITVTAADTAGRSPSAQPGL